MLLEVCLVREVMVLMWLGGCKNKRVYVASCSWIIDIHGYPIAAMNIMDGHGNRYLLVVASHPSYRQNPINRLYHPINIPLQS